MRKSSDPGEQKALADIAEYGCHVIHVIEEDDLPPFSYSVGIQQSSGAPEVIVIGLKRDLSHSIVNHYNSRVRRAESLQPGGLYSGFIEGFDVRVDAVDKAHYPEYFGWNRWLYGGDEFDVLQIVYPTTTGAWPWEAAAVDWFRSRQPLLRDNDGEPNQL